MLYILTGKSSSGKDTLLKKVVEKFNNIKQVRLDSSRPMREGESEGNPYYFKNRSEIEHLISSEHYISYKKYNTLVNGVPDIWYYGLSLAEITQYMNENNHGIVAIDPISALEIRKKIGPRFCEIVYIYSDDETRTMRAKQRGSYDETEWNRRLLTDEKDFRVFDEFEQYDKIIYNDEDNTIQNLVYDFESILDLKKYVLVLELPHYIEPGTGDCASYCPFSHYDEWADDFTCNWSVYLSKCPFIKNRI